MMAQIGGIIFTAFVAVGGFAGLTALLFVRAKWRMFAAQTNHTGVDSDVMLSKETREWLLLTRDEAREAKAEAKACRAKVDALEDHVDKLERIMRDGGMTPPPFLWPLLQMGTGND